MQIDLTRPNPARVIDYWLGGIHNFEIDRQLGDQVTDALPLLPGWQQSARRMLVRAVRYLIQDRQLRTIIDFGAGLPTCDNTHIAAHRIDPDVRVLYDDIDPLTSMYGQQILQNSTNALYVHGDAQEPRRILEDEKSHEFLRGERRVGVMYMALGHLMTDDQVRRAANELHEWTAPGSYWFLTHAPREWETEPRFARVSEYYRKARVQFYLRGREELLELLSPWELVPGGATFNQQWGLKSPDPAPLPIFSIELMVYR